MKDFLIKYYIAKGFPREKIALGLAFFAKCWSLTDGQNKNGILAPTTQTGQNTPISKYTGGKDLGYNEVGYC